MNKVVFSSSFDQRQKFKKIAVRLALFIVLALLLIFLIRSGQGTDLQTAYDTAVEQADFEEIIAIHAQNQSIIADTPAAESETEEVLQAIALRDTIESDLSAFIKTQIDAVMKGNSLTAEAAEKLSLSMTIVGNSSLELIDVVFRDYLLGKMSEVDYIHFLETLYPLPEFRRLLSDQVDNFALIRDFRTELEAAYQLMLEGEYMDSVYAFEELNDSEYSHIRALNRILHGLRNEALDQLYALRMPEIQQLIEQERLYDANVIIDTIADYFPEKDELNQAKVLTDQVVPDDVIYWTAPIESIAVKPLIADPDRAFDNDVFADRANKDLLTTEEFRLLLKALYENDYVLINGNEIVDERVKFEQVAVPAAKKPLLLFLDDFYFTPQRVESGVCSRLDLDQNSNVLGVVQDRSGEETLVRNSTAIGVLEEFLQEYPDFGFNGAKGVIVLSGVDGLLGYPLREDHLARVRSQAQSIGLNNYLHAVQDTDANKEKLNKIIEALQERQWVFASQSY
ncbi:MAG: hypothetical protein PHV73_07390, partial [Eubacteriales bacterium]|nr:hypothetical protein [Eubacteriales bacterium]